MPTNARSALLALLLLATVLSLVAAATPRGGGNPIPVPRDGGARFVKQEQPHGSQNP